MAVGSNPCKTFLAHLSRRLIGELIHVVYEGIRRPSVIPSSLNILYSFHISHIASRGRGKEKLCLYSNRIITLVAMATYSSHRIIMGNEEIDNFSVSLGIFGFFLQKCLLSSPLRFIRLLSKSVNLICCGRFKKGQFS